MSSIAAGTYCSEGNGIYRNYHNPQAVALKNLYGQIGNYVDYVSYDAAKNEISPPNGTSYTASEISIKHVPDGLCRVSNSLVKTIEYNGNAGGVMKFTYREFANDMARAAFTTDFSVDSKGSDVIAYKGAKFKVNKADNSSISYTIISGFDKAVTF
ncbi:hypothetical protein LD591_11415 [Salmonella enterica]|uniref:hypothetical protein n=1 Tax=unclassified Salmonella TaxID=2614656 RepID=UPI001FB82F6C|nr:MULTISPECIES: hypothetical protein [Salmonella]MDJ3504121.1 hypothetical protein [Salmonella enterica]MDJ3808404.1 hypothetical protein [Salmonella enterica]MDJ3897752.1 hypothetical protein [Salmonella enterica]MDJ4256074.1 hypothetical protein [Salmonella enterica]MDJ4264830.1 hypothetical protein [Salmonella enterica]